MVGEGVPVGLTARVRVAPLVAKETDTERGTRRALRPLDDEVHQRADPRLGAAP